MDVKFLILVRMIIIFNEVYTSELDYLEYWKSIFFSVTFRGTNVMIRIGKTTSAGTKFDRILRSSAVVVFGIFYQFLECFSVEPQIVDGKPYTCWINSHNGSLGCQPDFVPVATFLQLTMAVYKIDGEHKRKYRPPLPLF
ncbi:hypothetical protein BDC45DRAFT_538292 [Circinella umbellata]|nr:hypothetical protein BDC45DRAFT_538292 [Circinella umbellata]